MHYSFTYFPIKIVENRTRRLAEELRSLFPLTKEPGSIPCTQKAAHNFNSSPKRYNTILLVLQAPRTHMIQRYTCREHTHTHQKYMPKKFKRKI